MTKFNVPQGPFRLNRLPHRRGDTLLAWDAADEYLLHYLAEDLPSVDSRVLIMNDSFGALTVALSSFEPSAVSDSYLSQQATRFNLAANSLSEHSVLLSNVLEPLNGFFDLVLIKIPKNQGFFEYELSRLRHHLAPSTKVILAGMIKNLPASVWTLSERLIGRTTTSLARKKARLIFAEPDLTLAPPSPLYPVNYRLENTDYLISNHANVFSRDSLDIGTRLFLQHIPSGHNVCDIIDLGCGNGVVGLIAAERNPAATVHFIDESFMAVASAKENFERAFGSSRKASFRAGNCLTDFQSDCADLILCNPPFHQQHTIGDQIAVTMFKQSLNVLRKNGELWVIGNRHLRYHRCLDKFFGSHRIIASNSKFVVLKATKEVNSNRGARPLFESQ
ncbi:MAG: methyltransferase [Gammaproteobacteria bacterium]